MFVGMKAPNLNRFGGWRDLKFPVSQFKATVDTGLCLKIVIPVVVGSSPISHPSIHTP